MSRSLVVILIAGALALGGLSQPLAGQLGGGAPVELWRGVGVAQATLPVEAPGFVLRDLAGKPVRLASLRGRVVLLYFWATW